MHIPREIQAAQVVKVGWHLNSILPSNEDQLLESPTPLLLPQHLPPDWNLNWELANQLHRRKTGAKSGLKGFVEQIAFLC